MTFDVQKMSTLVREQVRWGVQRYAIGPSTVTSFDPNTTLPTLEATSLGQSSNFSGVRGGSLFMTSGKGGESGTGSWIRTAPFAGTAMLTAKGLDNNLYALGYAPNPAWATKASQSYIVGKGLWRPMVSGDMDIRTTGNAGAFFSQQGITEVRGGLVRHRMNGLDGTNEMRAATHVIAGPNNSIANEKLFGVADGIYVGVQRRFISPTDRLPTPLPVIGNRPIVPNLLALFSKTLSSSLLDNQGYPLFRGRVGDYVAGGIDTLGAPEIGLSGPYRAIYEWWSDTNPVLPALKIGIASATGDVEIDSIPTSPRGWNISVKPPGSVSWLTGLNLTLGGFGKLDVNYPVSMAFRTAGNFNVVSGPGGVTFWSPFFRVNAARISLGLSPDVVQGGIVTDKTYPRDYMTGLPIRGLMSIRAG
jgi:hypothetical protein